MNALFVHCNMLGDYYFAGRVEHTLVHGTIQHTRNLGDTTIMVVLQPDADASKGSEGSMTFSAWDPRFTSYFELKYVLNNKQNNSVVVTAEDNFEIVLNPEPDVLKSSYPVEVHVHINEKKK